MDFRFEINSATSRAIEAHFMACDEQFVPHLSQRVDITNYSAKIARYATLVEAWMENQLIGLVAGYMNDPKKEDCFVTSVSVLPNWHGRGVANRLMKNYIRHARESGFDHIRLSVDALNVLALELYRKHGFTDSNSDSNVIEMTLDLRTEI